MKADFHIHTKHSDGIKSQEEIFKIAQMKQIDYIAITDHDTCPNVEDSYEFSKKYNVGFIPGIELSTLEEGKPVHLLGFFRDESFKKQDMVSYYKFIKQSRQDRTYKFVEKLKEHFDIEITYDDVFSFSTGIIARPHIAKAIHQKYPNYSFDYIFEHFIGDNSKAFVPSSKLSVLEGLDLLRRNNCLIVLAHPTLLDEQIKDQVLSYNYDGLEAKYYRNKANDETNFRLIANKRNMIISAGSDYHGIENDSKHGTLGEVFLDGDDLKMFLQKYNERDL